MTASLDLGLEGRRALVTGGNSGIGEAIALQLGELGVKTAINYIAHPEAAESLAERIKTAGSEALPIEADIAQPDAVAGMFKRIDEEWGGVDILVNNAGIDGVRNLAWDSSPEDWRKVIDINLFGAYYCAREALSRMVSQQRGVVLNMSSVHELIAWSGYSAYAASKAAISMLTKTLAQEAAPHGVRVVALAPGAIKTPINRAVWNDPAQMGDLQQKIPLNRIGETAEVARMAAVLVSDVASYVTGSSVFVDGGMTDYPDFAHGG